MATNNQTLNQQKVPVQGTHIDNILQETEIGAVISKFKIPFISFVVAIILFVLGYGVYSSYSTQQNNLKSDKVFQFQETTYKDFKSKKIEVAEFNLKYDQLIKEIGETPTATPLLFDISKTMLERKDLEGSAKALDNILKSNSNIYVQYVAKLNLSGILEDQGKNEEAIKLLESLSNSKLKLLEDKVSLDLGRLYVKEGNKEKAVAYFQQVANGVGKDTTTKGELAKLAKIYLSQINK